MGLANGTRLGSYEIQSAIGAGGMGEVYRARDTKLHRDVALKILLELFAADPDRLARFEREARTLASLNHPHIAQLYGVEESGETPALVMELVEGPTLADRIAEGPIAIEEALPIARQIASALEAAHEAGIVHRDLKPANVKVRPDGTVKVLDFGLAKALASSAGVGADIHVGPMANSPTMTSPAMTRAGIILGTAAYMSPEQAKGKSVDRRADVWAFGVVLFEMLTGRMLFTGETMTDVLAAIVKETPDWAALPSATPSAIRRLLRRCLEKDPARRLDSMAAARLEIDDALEPAKAGPHDREAGPHDREADPHREAGLQMTWGPASAGSLAVVAALAALAGGAAMWALRPQPPDPPLRKFDLTIEKLQALSGSGAISPDATGVAYVAAGQLWIRDLDRLAPRVIPGTDGAEHPFWSPDSLWLGFAAAKKIWKVAASGGSPIAICDLPETGSILGATWSDDGTIAFAAWRGSLYEVPASGGDPKVRLKNDPDVEVDYHHPHYVAGGPDLLLSPHAVKGTLNRIELLSGDTRTKLVEVSGEGNELSSPLYSRTGHLLYVRAGGNQGVWALPFSASGRQVTGDPFRVAPRAGWFSIAADNTLVMAAVPDGGPSQLVWVERDGRIAGNIGREQKAIMQPALSPDGTRVAVAAESDAAHDIWVIDTVRGGSSRLTFDREDEYDPVWSADGKQIVFTRFDRAGTMLASTAADGTGKPRTLVSGRAPAFSPDGRSLVHIVSHGAVQTPMVAPVAPDGSLGTPAPLGQLADHGAARYRVGGGRVSPDGRFFAYTNVMVGQPREVFISRFPEGSGRWPVSLAGGHTPRWARESGELFFIAESVPGRHQFTVASVTTHPTLTVGTPSPLFHLAAASLDEDAGFDVAPDGKRILAVRTSSTSSETGRLTIVQNWFAEFANGKR